MSTDSREKIMAAGREIAQARGYGGLNFRDIAEKVGIKAASLYHHFPSKEDLGVAIARRYWEESSAELEALSASDPLSGLKRYPETFRRALANENSMCLCSFMAAEYDDLPESLKVEVQTFADVNIAWLRKNLLAASVVAPRAAEARARAIYAAVVGAQLMARSRSDLALYDAIIAGYRSSGLIP